jgi:hypothetical protein
MVELDIMNITNLYIHRVCMLIHPFIHPQTQLNRPEHNHHYLWTTQIHDYPTRHSLQKQHYIPNPNAFKNSREKTPMHETSYFAKQDSSVWNSIPERIRDITNRNSFKRALKEHLIETQIFEL